METTKLRRIIDKYKLTNLLKIATILIVLFLLYRSFINTSPIDVDDVSDKVSGAASYAASYISPKAQNMSAEGFTNMSYTYYGNNLTLQDPTNKPIYRGNTCTFNFDGMYRIEAFTVVLNHNNNVNTNSTVKPFKNNTALPLYIQYLDGNGNLRYIQSSSNTSSIPNFNNTMDLTSTGTSYKISKDKLVDENNLAIYTSSVVITIGDTSNMIDGYQDSCGIGYIGSFGFWGSTRDMLSQNAFEQLSPSLGTLKFNASSNSTSGFNQSTNTDNYTFTNSSDYFIYGLVLTYTIVPTGTATPTSTSATSATDKCTRTILNTDGPFKLILSYNNGLYSGNSFKINQNYTVRNDPLVLANPSSKTYIQFPQPFIANTININVPRVSVMDSSGRMLRLNLTGLDAYGATPSTTDIAMYQKNVNLSLTAEQSGKNQDICPSMDDLVSKQNQAQAVCDNIEYQDKIKSEKIRLEKNKQYLLKLQQQQQQIDQLNTVIQTLDNKRQSRATANDQARVLQYQQQRGTASTIRDLANQRLQSQAANQLYMDVNINTI